MTTTLQRDRNNHCDHRNHSHELCPLNKRHDESDISDEKKRHHNDMKHKIHARAVIARITFPLPTKQLQDAHFALDCSALTIKVTGAPRRR